MIKVCSECGMENTDNAKFCKKCGEPLVDKETMLNSKQTSILRTDNTSFPYKKMGITFLWALLIWFIFIIVYFSLYIGDIEQVSIPILGHVFFSVVNLSDEPLFQVFTVSLLAGVSSLLIPFDSKLKYVSLGILMSFIEMLIYGIYNYGFLSLFQVVSV